MCKLFTSENLGMSPASVKSENELGPVTLLPVGTAVITQLSYRDTATKLPREQHPKAAGHGDRPLPRRSRVGSFQRVPQARRFGYLVS